jgi:hypothetical protein
MKLLAHEMSTQETCEFTYVAYMANDFHVTCTLRENACAHEKHAHIEILACKVFQIRHA